MRVLPLQGGKVVGVQHLDRGARKRPKGAVIFVGGTVERRVRHAGPSACADKPPDCQARGPGTRGVSRATSARCTARAFGQE